MPQRTISLILRDIDHTDLNIKPVHEEAVTFYNRFNSNNLSSHSNHLI